MRYCRIVFCFWISISLVISASFAMANPTWEKIIDDRKPGYSETGNAWATWNTGGYGGSYRYLSHGGKNLPRRGTATWQITIPYDGQYEVAVHFRQTVNRTTDADYNVYDGNGKRHHFSLNQQKLATGWHVLGTFYWKKGQKAKVVLDGTDDNQSDEADATRWRLKSNKPPPSTAKCTQQTPGTYKMTRYAGKVSATSGWTSPTSAQGKPDNKSASSPNVDKGEILTASDFLFCVPPGSFKITKVQISILARTQYSSGPYKLNMKLEGAGKSFTFSQTSLKWVHGDITSAKPAWTINDVNVLELKLGLHSHPGGKRDSDAWVDAFAIEVTYQVSKAGCPSGQTDCSGKCVNVQSDAKNCGKCGQVCPSNLCTGGKCSCPSPTKLCGSTCVDVSKDNKNCGNCGKVCPSDSSCSGGSCVKGCAKPRAMCSGICTDTSSDPKHCGGCGKACQAGFACVTGSCAPTCGRPQVSCGGKCTDTSSDAKNCGSCGKACTAGEFCSQGKCGLSCGKLKLCGKKCVDTQTDLGNCGSCGNACFSGQTCANGKCSKGCKAPEQLCAGKCTDVTNDPDHCGNCGKACQAGQVCASSACASQCPSGMLLCERRCIDVSKNKNHCGGCSKQCPADSDCFGGVCKKANACLTGRTFCGGACVDTKTNAQHCGACDNPCKGQQRCEEGVCGSNTEAGSTADGGSPEKTARGGCACAQGPNSIPTGLIVFGWVWLLFWHRRKRSNT